MNTKIESLIYNIFFKNYLRFIIGVIIVSILLSIYSVESFHVLAQISLVIFGMTTLRENLKHSAEAVHISEVES